jgi:hypothetical protein
MLPNTSTPTERIYFTCAEVERMMDQWNIPRADHIKNPIDRIQARVDFVTSAEHLTQLNCRMAEIREAHHAQ